MRQKLIVVLVGIGVSLTLGGRSGAETVTLATYNIEWFGDNFLAFHASSEPYAQDPDVRRLINVLRKKNDEDNWEIAQTILHPRVSPDIIVIQEGCEYRDLAFFNQRWLDSAYETLIVFPSNSTRGQNLAMMLKPGFKVIERRDQYHLEPDPSPDRSGPLFARGPVFCLVETPGGHRLWVGTTHQKSKAVFLPEGKDDPELERKMRIEATQWRNREAARTHEIIRELERRGPKDVILLGDMNDDPGMDEIEKIVGADSIALLVGPPAAGLILATQPLVDRGEISFGGYWRTRYRSFIDHIVITRSLGARVKDVRVFTEHLAPVASDHYPVVIELDLSK